jgi:peptidoglycan/LPS O-acetylase OafA/YrhL
MNQVLAYLPNVLVAILIFVVAALISGAVAAGVSRVMGDTPTGKIVATVVPALVMVIAMFMILEQLQIAPEIVRIAFAAVMFALALGLALAFGLGGRGVAQQLLEDGYRKGREQRDQVKADLAAGRARTGEHAADTPSHLNDDGLTSTSTFSTGDRPQGY